MRRAALPALLAAFLAALPAAASAGEWKRLAPADLSKPAMAESPLRELWSGDIRAADRYMVRVAKVDRFQRAGVDAPFPSISHRFEGPDGASVTVSMALYGDACDAGANSATSTQLWALCPMKVEVVRGDVRRVVEGRGCYLDVQSDRSPGAPTVADNGSFAYLDRRRGELTVETIQGGKPVVGCTKVVRTGS